MIEQNNKPHHYTSNLTKGAAVLTEMRTLLVNWIPGENIDEYLERVLATDLLGKRTATRTRDLVKRIFYPRYIAHDDRHARWLKYLFANGNDRDIFREISFVYSARADNLLYDFILERFWQITNGIIQPKDVFEFLEHAAEKHFIKSVWSKSIQTLCVRSVLRALREFGLIREESYGRRVITNYRISDAGLAYLAYELHFSNLSDTMVVENSDWALFGLTKTRVLERLEELGVSSGIFVQRAGSVVQITWSHSTMEAMIDAIKR